MLKEKLTSRKFLSALISIITGLLLIFGVEESVTSLISGALLIMVPAIVYIFTEGKIDAAAVATQIDFDAYFALWEEYLKKQKSVNKNTAAQEAAAIKTGDRGSEPPGGTI